jgi:ABC-type methionine transport system ATPase subunit
MAVRLAFSLSINVHAEILLMDEVLAVGDTNFQTKCLDEFLHYREVGKTVVIVTHDISVVRRFCDRAMLLENSHILKIGRAEEVCDLYTLHNIDAMQGQGMGRGGASSSAISAFLDSGDKKKPILYVKFSSTNTEQKVVGMSILMDGVSIAEYTTGKEMELIKAGKVSYQIDTTSLNAGVYSITVALFKQESRELLATGDEKILLKVDGNDPLRGGALRLEGNWKVE